MARGFLATAIVVVLISLAFLLRAFFGGGEVKPLGDRSALDSGTPSVGTPRRAESDGSPSSSDPAARLEIGDPDRAAPKGGLPPESSPERLLRVRVLDQDGAPCAAASVRMCAHPDRPDLLMTARCDEAGIARFRLQETHVDWRSRWAELRVAGAAAEMTAQVDLANPPTEPVDLVVGAVGVIVVALDHARLPEGTIGRLGGKGEDSFDRVLDGDELVFAPVPLGEDFVFGLMLPRGSAEAFANLPITGPTRPGERLRVRFDLDAPIPQPVVVARLVDEEGRPFARSAIRVSAGRADATSLCSDGEGRVRWNPTKAGEVRFVASRDDGTTSRSEVESLGLRPGVDDLGDVVLRPLPLVAAGLVRDGVGHPVAGARVVIHRVRWNRDGGSVWTFWQGATGPGSRAGALTDAAGRFALRDKSEATRVYSEIQLEVDAPGFEPQQVVIGAGGEEVVIVLARLAGLRLHCEAAPGGGLGSVLLRSYRSGPKGRRSDLEWVPDARGHIAEDRLEAGRVDLELVRRLLGRDDEESIAHWDDCLLVGGETLDLGRVTVPAAGFEGRILLELGPEAPREDFLWSLRAAAGARILAGFSDRDGPLIRYATTAFPVELQVGDVDTLRIDRPEVKVVIDRGLSLVIVDGEEGGR
ncbi:MAG: carboxypeptidase regulatory-like domain-containing protein [Planctomycetes bacterium]|nr:carboxypeptidase regulatory-like domain-containing protein [Planctomycetota bacterium]